MLLLSASQEKRANRRRISQKESQNLYKPTKKAETSTKLTKNAETSTKPVKKESLELGWKFISSISTHTVATQTPSYHKIGKQLVYCNVFITVGVL